MKLASHIKDRTIDTLLTESDMILILLKI